MKKTRRMVSILMIACMCAFTVACSSSGGGTSTGTSQQASSAGEASTQEAQTAETADTAEAAASAGDSTQAEAGENSGSGAQISFGFSNPAPEAHPQNVAFYWMAEELARRSNGNIQMTVFPNGNAGTIMECFQMCVDGTLEMAAGSLSTLANYDPGMGFVDMPYFWTSVEAMIACMEVYGQEMTQKLCDMGVIAMGFGDNDYYDYMFTNKEVHTLEDMKGIKMRCQENDIIIRLAEVLGMNPTVVPSTETWTGLQTGVIEGHDMGAIISYSGSYYDVSKYYLVTHHAVRVEYVFANEAWWNSLDPLDQQLIKEVFDEMIVMMNEGCAEMRETAIETMEAEHGVTVVYPSEETLAEMEALAKGLWDEFKDVVNYDLMMEMHDWMVEWEAKNG